MRTRHLIVALLAVVAFAPFGGTTASAQATRTWVSGVGDDVNPCSRTAPCKTFAGAISKTAANGEIDCLDPAGFGAVTIIKSMTIDCTNTLGSILITGANGININGAGIAVRLRGLSIFGAGSGVNGINIIAAGSVIVEQSVIGEFTTSGINVNASATVNLLLNDVTIRASGVSAIALATSAGQVVGGFTNVRLDGAPTCLSSANRNRLTMRAVFVSHCNTGLIASGTDNIVNVDGLVVSFASTGVQSASGSTYRLSNSLITQNLVGLNANGGAIVSLSGNSVNGNTTDGSFTSTVPKI